ncbi:GNAT family N-acetyltransferase [Demequina sediminicola]|uniref:GNAT family N-acetyltransferase n=1 Tax=Demequina sediminicola TaxID=1095026 RepID=UPI0007820E4A|nr:GNAT family N-acetyltransferase [Demequina sediminicola]
MTQEHTTVVARNDAASRYEYLSDGELAGFIEFRQDGAVTVLTHTEVEPGLHGTGAARELAEGALENLAKLDATVRPECSYLSRFIRREGTHGVTVEWPEGH